VEAGRPEVIKHALGVEELEQLLECNPGAVGFFLRWLSRHPDSELADRLGGPDAEEVLNFDAALGAARFVSSYRL
jgi:hypothetical protein